MAGDPALRSRRSITLRFDIPVAKTKRFWDSLKEGRLETTKCGSCGRVSFPPQADCPECRAPGCVWVELGRDATLLTFTRVEVPPASFAGLAPYTIAVGELEGGVRVLAWLEVAGPAQAKVGMRLRLEARGGGGSPHYAFVPA